MALDPSKSPQAAWSGKKRPVNHARIILVLALIPPVLVAFPLLVHLVVFGGKPLYVNELLFFVVCDVLLTVVILLLWFMPHQKPKP
jgi:hypothetical protein